MVATAASLLDEVDRQRKPSAASLLDEVDRAKAPTAASLLDQVDASKAPVSEGYGDAVLYGLGQPLRNIGTTARVLGAETVGSALERVPVPEGYAPASERVLKPQEGDFAPFGIGVGSIPRASVEQAGQLVGSLLSRGAGVVAGGAMAGAPGAVVGGIAAPTIFGAAQVLGSVAEERARNNGRETPNREDILAAFGTAVSSGLIDAASAKFLSEASGPILRRLGLGALFEGGTEGAQSVAEQTGATLGTEAGLEVSPRQAVAEALIGAGPGAAAAGVLGTNIPQRPRIEEEPTPAPLTDGVPPPAPVATPEGLPDADAIVGLKLDPDAAPTDVQVQRYFTTPDGDQAVEVRTPEQETLTFLAQEFQPLVTPAARTDYPAFQRVPAPGDMPPAPPVETDEQLAQLAGMERETVVPPPPAPSPQTALALPETRSLDALVRLRNKLEVEREQGSQAPGLGLRIRDLDAQIADLEQRVAARQVDTTTGATAPRTVPLPGALGAAAAQGKVGVSAAEVPLTRQVEPAQPRIGDLTVPEERPTVAQTGEAITRPRAPGATVAPTGTPLEMAAQRPGFVSAAEVPLQTGRPTTAAERQRQRQLELERNKPVAKPPTLIDALRKIGLRRDDPALNDLRNRDSLPKSVFRKDGKSVAEALTILEGQGFPVKPSGVEQYTAQDVDALSEALDQEFAGRPVWSAADAEQGGRWLEQERAREDQASFEGEWGPGAVGRARHALSTQFGVETPKNISLGDVNRLLNQKLLDAETDAVLSESAIMNAMDVDARARDDYSQYMEETYDPFDLQADTGRDGRPVAQATAPVQPRREGRAPAVESAPRGEAEGAVPESLPPLGTEELTDAQAAQIDADEEAAIRAPQPTRQPMLRKAMRMGKNSVDRLVKAYGDRLLGRDGQPLSKQQMLSTTAQVNQATAPAPRYEPAYDLPAIARFTTFAQGVASNNEKFAEYHRAVLDEHYQEAGLIREGEAQLMAAFELPDASKEKIKKVLEHDRLTRTNRKVGAQRVVVQMPARYHGELAKPGDVVSLSAAETKALGDIRKFLDDRWVERGKAMMAEVGYDGAYNQDAIDANIRAAQATGRNKDVTKARYALEIFKAIEDARRKGYVPFMRYGDVVIKITPKGKEVEGKDGIIIPEGGRVEFVESNTPWWSVFGRKAGKAKIVNDRVAELQKRYPTDKFDYSIKDIRPSDIENLDIPLIEKLFMAVSIKDPKVGAELFKNVLEQVYKDRTAGIYRESRNIPGYSTDFFRSLADYNRVSSVVISKMQHGQRIRDAYAATQKEPPGVAGFAKRFNEYLDSDEAAIGRLKQFGFWANIWGSPSSAIVNLIQTPTITAAQIAGWGGGRAWVDVNKLMGSVSTAIRADTKEGAKVDFDRIKFRSDTERADFMAAVKSGLIDPTVAQELQGDERSTFGPSKQTRDFLGRVFKVGASMFNTAEQVNRAVAWLAAYRAIQNPSSRNKFMRMYAKDKRVQALLNQGRDTPADVARFVVEDTQFIGGKFDRPEALRGLGGVAFQFKQYPLNYMRILWGNFKRLGPEGRTAGLIMITTMMALSGLLGLPFAEDVLNFADAIGKFATKVDPMLERELRNFIGDPGWAETILRGPSRAVTGVDLSKRFGVGEIAPEADLLLSIPILGATYGRLAEFQEREGSGQPVGAATALAAPLVGKGPADLMRGLAQLPEEGLTTRRGEVRIPPSEITAPQMAAKSAGLQPAAFAREQERARSQQRIRYKTQDAENALRSKLAGTLARSIAARRAGDEEEANRLLASFQAARREALEEFRSEPVLEDRVRVPDMDVLRRRALEMLDPALRNRTAAKTKRRALAEEDAFVSGRE